MSWNCLETLQDEIEWQIIQYFCCINFISVCKLEKLCNNFWLVFDFIKFYLKTWNPWLFVKFNKNLLDAMYWTILDWRYRNRVKIVVCSSICLLKKLIKKYENNISLLGATYVTTKYAAPVLFVAIETNFEYMHGIYACSYYTSMIYDSWITCNSRRDNWFDNRSTWYSKIVERFLETNLLHGRQLFRGDSFNEHLSQVGVNILAFLIFVAYSVFFDHLFVKKTHPITPFMVFSVLSVYI